jgi:uncharacterized protein YyaL (SSP411 family)
MKKIILILLFSTIMFANNINWVYDFDEAKALAKEENKIVMMFISMQTCPVCEFMKEKVFTVKEIQDYLNKNMVMLHVDLDMDEVPMGLECIGTPTTYFIRPDGSLIGEAILGATKAPYYIKKLQPYVDQK